MTDFISIGSITRDVFMQSKGIRTVHSKRFKTGAAECVPLGSKIEVNDIFYTVGGSAANAAVTFARQGFSSGCIGRLGEDVRASETKKVLAKEKLDVSYLQFDSAKYTAYSSILLTPSGERSILAYRGAGEFISSTDISWNKLAKAKWFYITHLAGHCASLYPKLINFAAKHGIKVATNPGSSQLLKPAMMRSLLKHVDILILNKEEASYFVNITYKKTDAIFSKLDNWVKGWVVMTDGPNGVSVSDGKTRYHAGVLKERKMADRTGAGDAFGSGFVAEMHRNKGNVEKAIAFASANATSVIEYIGAHPGILKKGQSSARWGKLKITKQNLH
ncbi:MAG: hypothetical protein A3A97_03280 [Candidatus Terrybacteria bacterium RIFCSPLOWO2_01_FULL_40_23]|uniref:Carbohydrate kinase PfkB domain-containing protein n=1 Tax=Candidatus Terrybacteria bacterium RIFCSPLOWO2_01_FULL_40_23 TaxID=1802366 RepID=A0A1G2PQE8_9BACT|nr:MAG: hypothetical protein A3A97_03280 [Candidatus Terrybacteria bacterium RIFCSPLOWO2_01_FULL_40_23]